MVGQKSVIVLIVDDISDDRAMARMILEKNGFSVEEACDWRVALKKVKDGGIDLVLLDIHMPELDGIELMGIIRKENSREELPIILYTATARDREEYDNKGADGFIRKYDSPKVLIEKIKELLRSKLA